MHFEKYPFEKLNELLKGVKPSCKYEPMTLTIGEPQFQTPLFIQNELKDKIPLLNKYPKSGGEEFLKKAQRDFFERRFGVKLENDELLPTFGTRELLFNFPQFLLFDKQDPLMAFTNPFYQIYEGAAVASRAKIVYLNLSKENNFLPDINNERLKECDLVILNFPNNPTASVLSLEELSLWAKKALEFDFVLINDECYSEIYINKPHSLLEATKKIGNDSFKNILVLNSISKRSSAPGLRSGFIAGDRDILTKYLRYRTYIGCASPLPLQYAAAIAWEEEEHVAKAREGYKKNFLIAKEILGIDIPEATFYIWMEVEDDISFTKRLYEKKNLKVLPGSYLGREGAGKGYIRIALVENEKRTKEAMERIRDFIKEES